MDANYFWKQSRAVSKEFCDRRIEIAKELGMYSAEGFSLRLDARERGELPPIKDATSMDDYMDKYRQQLTEWQHSQTVVENLEFEQRLSTKWAQRDRDIRPHEQAVLEFKEPEPEEPPKFVPVNFELLF